jgi:hypothetical protein
MADSPISTFWSVFIFILVATFAIVIFRDFAVNVDLVSQAGQAFSVLFFIGIFAVAFKIVRG